MLLVVAVIVLLVIHMYDVVCCRLSDKCWSNSLLELWDFDKEKINGIKSAEEIQEKIAETTLSPVYQTEYTAKDWLGGLSYDDTNSLVDAKAAKMLYVIKATSTDDLNNRIVVRNNRTI